MSEVVDLKTRTEQGLQIQSAAIQVPSRLEWSGSLYRLSSGQEK